MFENIGKNGDAEGGRRRIAALLLTLGASTFVTGLTIALLAWRTVPVVLDIIEDDWPDTIVELPLPGEDDPLTLPAAPPMLAAARSAPTEPQPDPSEPADPQTLPDVVPDDVADGSGTPDGDLEGDPDGQPGSKGVPGGTGDGDGDGVVTLNRRDVTLRGAIVKPVYPDAALDLNLGPVDCVVEVSIDERGKVYDVGFRTCPMVFQDSAEEALFRWRYYPAQVEGVPVKAKFLIKLEYIP